MPTEDELLTEWRAWKSTSHHYFRLQHEVEQSFEYQGPQWGHPSNYALTRFRCEPADGLLFIAQAHWPEHLPPEYCALLERAIGRALVDSLLAVHYPYRGCAVTLIEVGWDDVMSSEAAFYHATKGAMDQLRSNALWDLVARSAPNA